MRNLKNEKGAISMLVLVSILFVTAFLITSYVILANKVQTQKEIVSQTKLIYESGPSMEETYNSFFDTGNLIPIYTAEQLKKIGSGDKVSISEEGGKYYEFTNSSVYVLMNDLEIDQDEISKSFEGKFESNGHTITMTNEFDEQCVCNKDNNFHGILMNMPQGYVDTVSNIVGGVPIPKGFKYVKGTVNTGIVITDAFSGIEDEGNEFVWIPVNSINNFTRTAFNNERLEASSGTVGSYWVDESTEEFGDIEASITKYQGFYFGRFETSKIPDIEQNVAQIKRGYLPWTDIIDSAARKSNEMYDSEFISTHLVYPQEWDCLINWLISSGGKSAADVTQDSTAWGNYKVLQVLQNISTVQQTGSSELTVANNIYDLAGNVSEITMEQKYIALGNNHVTIRGGSFKTDGDDEPASSRDDTTGAKEDIGFRICMIINE